MTYNGPAVKDTKPAVVKIAVFGPNAEEAVHTPEALHAVQLAANSGQHISLIGISSDASWGKSSSQLVDAIYSQHVLGIIALDRNSSHFAEQLGLKSFVPVLALATDKTLTSTNIPWIFRMPAQTTLRPGDCLPRSRTAQLRTKP